MIDQKYQLAMQNLAIATDLVFTLTVEVQELKKILEEYERTTKGQAEDVSGRTPVSDENN